jgi:hypothetical protein
MFHGHPGEAAHRSQLRCHGGRDGGDGVIANCTRCRITTSLYSSIAFNALASSNKLLPAARRVNSGGSVSRSPESGGGRGRGKKSGAALMAAATRVEVVWAGLSQVVRESKLAKSSRAAAVARAQQLLAQASLFVESSVGLLLLPGAVASAGGPQHGVSGDVCGFPSLELSSVELTQWKKTGSVDVVSVYPDLTN